MSLVADGYEQTSLPTHHKVALACADVFLRDPRDLGDDLRQKLMAEFRPEEIVELTAILAIFLNFSKVLIALGLEPENMPTTVLPTPDVPQAAAP